MHLFYYLFSQVDSDLQEKITSLLFMCVPLASIIPVSVPRVSLDTAPSLTFPVCPFRFEMFSRLVVVKMWITFPLTAANRWPPLLKAHYKEIELESENERNEQSRWRLWSRAQAETMCGGGNQGKAQIEWELAGIFRPFHYSCSPYWPRCWQCHV